MMDDIVEVLRNYAEATSGDGNPALLLSWRAADEIERLRSTIHDLSGQENVEGRLIEMKRVGHAEAVALMPDVSDRMRNRYKRFGDDDALIAAEEIDRLRDENRRLRETITLLREGIIHLKFWSGDFCDCTGDDPPCPYADDFYTQPSDAECENKRLKEVSDRMARELQFMADEIVRLRSRYEGTG